MLIASHHFDILLIAGDFNVDFDRPDPFHSLLVDFTSELDMSVCDLPFKTSVRYTYEGSQSPPPPPPPPPPTWIDHVLCFASHSSLATDVYSIRSGHILSDHFPYVFPLLLTALMHNLLLPFIGLFIAHLTGLMHLKMTLSDSVLWLLITLVLYLLEFTTVSHHPALVTVPISIPILWL